VKIHPNRRPAAGPWLPAEMAMAPPLDPDAVPGPMRRRYALLINPFYRKDPNCSFGKHVLTPTLALAATAAGTPPHWELRYWDENLLQGPPPLAPFPEVVGITVHLTFATRAYQLAGWYRQWGAKVILGGLHVSSAPDEAASHADAIAIGEGVQLWPEILKDVEAGKLKPVYRGDYRRSYRDDPMPRKDLLSHRDFLTTSSVVATRGCHNRCGFCYLSTRGVHMPYQLRDAEQVVAEIKADGQPYNVFVDNNLGSRPEYLRRLCKALAPLKIIWSAALTLDVTDDPTLVKDMALAGCTGVFIGFESLSLQNLEDARKRTSSPDDYARRVKILHHHGIQVNGSFVLGFDQDGPDVFERTVTWIEENRLECATFHILTPYPGTPLFRQLEEQNRIVHRDWRLYDTAHVVFEPALMTAEQLYDGYQWCYRRLFSHRSIWLRRPGDWSSVPPYLAMSYLYKRSNRVWRVLIRKRLAAAAWRPLIELSRWRHLRFRDRLRRSGQASPKMVISAGV
jgi:radical SAM superfamily enzyme YgiQ (UPF0313 family)